ncbi:hypothetical protein EZV62_010124 [Acer yangbiense]|uniref:Protein kinase domain-containing protein n=1 Tax=Acer yangbiense TaxID=1000413 RepID=A0A5C7I1S4_9ROSI|nr:hypothetical protein EZV62_010124 [Acer yangbiense]
MDQKQVRLIGDYIVGPRIGSGSFAVVWKATHRQLGIEVAVKEIDKKLLSPKTKERIYLVLEYCDGGDLAAYLHRHGKVSEAVARHFMRQLAAGLQVLHEKHLIHRDLKPQNLFLSTNEATPVLKIGDFGFARSLTPQDLADTLCGSPLYMAPEIIQNHKYDAKADLWSVGAILFQLVTGKPPFDGNNQLQLFQNILTSTELQFPVGALEDLHPDCVDLCRSLLRQNPVERITFKEFFTHKFLGELRQAIDVEQAFPVPQMESVIEQFNSSIPEERPASSRNPKSACSSIRDKIVLHMKDRGNTSSTKVADLMESIEKEYVLVNPHFASMDAFSYYLDTSVQDASTSKVSSSPSKKGDHLESSLQTKELAVGAGSSQSLVSAPLELSWKSSILKELQGLTILHPSTRLQLLHQYVHALAELAQEKYNAGLFLESFSVELVVLAIWKKAFQICDSWMTSESELPSTSSGNKSTIVQDGTCSASNSDFSNPSSVAMWAEKGFIVAFDRAEKLSNYVRDMDVAAEMPDAMEIIYHKALSVGKSGAVEEYMENKITASKLYSKSMLLLSFIVGEATSLPLNPPFSLTPANKKLIQSYIDNLQSRQSHFLMSQPSPKQSSSSIRK